jgi:hypothetical protein
MTRVRVHAALRTWLHPPAHLAQRRTAAQPWRDNANQQRRVNSRSPLSLGPVLHLRCHRLRAPDGNNARPAAQSASISLGYLSGLKELPYLLQLPVRLGADCREPWALGVRATALTSPQNEQPVCGARSWQASLRREGRAGQAPMPLPCRIVDGAQDPGGPGAYRGSTAAAPHDPAKAGAADRIGYVLLHGRAQAGEWSTLREVRLSFAPRRAFP